MFEGFDPTEKTVEIIRDYFLKKITLAEAIKMATGNTYGRRIWIARSTAGSEN